jgi:hypothetical protein
MEQTVMIKDMKRFLFYLKYVWPMHRMFAKKHLSKRCKRCFLNEKYTDMVDGICRPCREYKPQDKKNLSSMQEEIGRLLNSYFGKGKADRLRWLYTFEMMKYAMKTGGFV